jgi:uncharacterized protein YndB with AHSA1/START domain
MMTNTKTSVDRDTFTITFRRSFPAPREQVFDAWTQPEQIKYWWDPSGTPLADCFVDLRPGGAFRFATASGHAPPFSGVYQVIERPAELVFDALGAIGTVRLELESAATRMTVSIRCTSLEHLEQFLKLGVDVGTERTLDNLVAHVTSRPRAR